MKILFTADIHIKLGQKSVPIDWNINRFNMFINQLSAMQERADLLVLGGDIFDRVPSTAELELYFKLISSINIPCVVYSGNHEAIKKDTTFLSHLVDVSYAVNNNVVVIDKCCTLYGIDFIPYNHLKDKEWPTPKSRILCTHVRGEIPPHVKPEIDLSRLDPWDLVLAGDLHSYSNSQRNILYPGSPYTISFHRNPVETFALLVDSNTLEHEYTPFRLPQLLRKTINCNEEMIRDDFHNVVYEVEGSLEELSSLKNSDLLGKKVSKSNKDTSLILKAGLSITGEVREYLTYVLNLNASEVSALMQELEAHKGSIDI